MYNFIQIYSSIKKEQKPIIQFLERQKTKFISNNFKSQKNKKTSLIIISFLCLNEFIYSLLRMPSFFIYANLFSFFAASKIYYEESSWFDIRIFQKVNFLIKNDKFFLNFKLKKQCRLLYKSIVYFFSFFLLYFLSNY